MTFRPTQAQDLIAAIQANDTPRFERLLVASPDVRAMDRAWPGGLIQAALRAKGVARMHMVALLARRGARVDIHNDFGIPPLFEVLTSTFDNAAQRLRTLSSLLSAGADPNECVHEESIESSSASTSPKLLIEGPVSALGIAAQVGDTASLELLLSSEADPNSLSCMVSPLRTSLRYNQLNCAATLLVAGANPALVDREGWTPVVAVSNQESLELLEAAGVNLSARVGPYHETLFQAWCQQAPDDLLLRPLARRYPQQVWDRDARGEHAVGKLWARWARQREDWIPRLVSELEGELFSGSTAMASGGARPPRL